MLFYEKDFARIDFVEEGNINFAMHTWKLQNLFPDEYKEAMKALLDLLRDKRTAHVVFNCKNLGAIAPEEIEWSVKNWIMPAVRYGLSSWAIVMPESIFGELSIKELVEVAKKESSRINEAYFDSIEGAKLWVMQRDAELLNEKKTK